MRTIVVAGRIPHIGPIFFTTRTVVVIDEEHFPTPLQRRKSYRPASCKVCRGQFWLRHRIPTKCHFVLKKLLKYLPASSLIPPILLVDELEIAFGLRGAAGPAEPGLQLFAAEGALRARGARNGDAHPLSLKLRRTGAQRIAALRSFSGGG